ncbi:transcriptional regulator GZF3-like [Octopus vulgaris]|uniref:Transcriptional regulator GZF3-like n=1 Tax=Octopus vulgaris TaxID=6645 RepID=A0AA36F6W5_OCTVU|nr:transcriptional regulator GZF3-like [Octopus vulgaris]
MDKDEQSAILALLSLQYQIPCQVTKIKAEPSVDPLTTYSTYNSHHHHHHHHHQHHHHHHLNLPLKSVAIKEETLLLPDQICSTPIDPPFSRQVKPFAKLSPLQPVVENPTNSVIASRVVPSAKSTAAVAATPREKNVIASEDRCKRRRRGNLPKEAVRVMTDWLKSNRYNAYPSEDDKLKMATSLNIKHKQVSNWFINARRRKLTQILHKEGKDSKDYRITRKKKNTSLDEGRATSSETEVSTTNLSTSSYPSPSSSTSSASDGSLGTGAVVSAKQRRRSGGARNNSSSCNARHRRQSRLSAMPPTPCSLTSFEGNTSSDDDDDEEEEEEEEVERRGGEQGRDFVTFQQRNLEAEVRTLNFENL